MGEDLFRAIDAVARDRDEAGTTLRCLDLGASRQIAREFGVSAREVHVAALERGVVPLRYLKNIGTIGVDGQLKLLGSRVVVVGAGGIGGNAASLLARMGVGTIVLVDADVFDETNLNRQCFATEEALGAPKVETMLGCLVEINRDVEVVDCHLEANRDNLPKLVRGADVVIDALDTLSDRLALENVCRSVGVVMVHGAIAGDCLQVMTVYPGDPGLSSIVPAGGPGKTRGIEVETGNPATTPALAAAFQVQEAVKVILGRGETLRGRMLYIDTGDWTIELIEL